MFCLNFKRKKENEHKRSKIRNRGSHRSFQHSTQHIKTNLNGFYRLKMFKNHDNLHLIEEGLGVFK